MTRASATESASSAEIDYLPTESQMTLLCLDYLRDLRRAYKDPQDMLDAEGLHADWLTLAIYALNRSFSMQGPLKNSAKATVNYNQVTMPVFNDSWMDSHRVLTEASPAEQEEMMNPTGAPPKRLSDLPTLKEMTKQILLSENPRESRDERDEKKNNSFERYGTTSNSEDSFFDSYAWYEYDDAHPSNANRFYLLDGLAGNVNGRGPLLLGEIMAAGLCKLKAKARLVAEDEMVETPLFEQFVLAVESKGFFDDPDNDEPQRDPQKEEERLVMQKAVYDERMAKVVCKFRSKLAARMESEQGLGSMTKLADYHHGRRMKRVVIAKSRISDNQHLSHPMSPIAPMSPTSIGRLDPNVAEAEAEVEAERLKSNGNAFMQKKEYDAALECYTQALRMCPNGPHSHVYFSNRAAALLSMKMFKEAIIDSERALSLSPTYGKAHARLGLAHFLLGDYRRAMEAYTVALKYEPDNKSSKSYLEKAAKKLAAMSDLEVPNTETSYSVVSEWDKSKVTKRKGSSGSSSEAAEKFKTLGNTQMANRDYQSSFESYSTAIELSPHGAQSHVYYANRAAALCYLERYEEAAEDAELAIALKPNYGKGHARLGLSRYFLNDFEASVAAYKTALKYDPDNASSKSYLAKAEARLEKEQEGRINVEEEARRLMADPDMMHMAKKMIRTGKSLSQIELLEDPEMKKFARKAMADPVMMEAIKNISKVDPASPALSPRR